MMCCYLNVHLQGQKLKSRTYVMYISFVPTACTLRRQPVNVLYGNICCLS